MRNYSYSDLCSLGPIHMIDHCLGPHFSTLLNFDAGYQMFYSILLANKKCLIMQIVLGAKLKSYCLFVIH